MNRCSRYRPPWLIRKLTSPWLVWGFTPGSKTIYLSFDDGPDANVTPQVLDILDHYDAKATFFLCGQKAVERPDLADCIRSKGHATGNHTYQHVNGMYVSAKTYLGNVEECSKVVPSKLFRPPYGMLGPLQIKKLRYAGYIIIMWTVLSHDFESSIDPDVCLHQSINHTTDGSIVVFHDSEKAAASMLYVLPEFLAHFIHLGYTFAAINENALRGKPGGEALSAEH